MPGKRKREKELGKIKNEAVHITSQTSQNKGQKAKPKKCHSRAIPLHPRL